MASAFGAGAGADMLQDVLKRKLLEQQAMAQQAQFAQKLAEDKRQADMTNVVQQGNLSLGGRRVDEDVRQFNENAPTRIANVGHLNASTGELQRRPTAEQQAREFTKSQTESQQKFQGGQGDLNRGNALRIAGMNGQNALAVANVRHPDTAGAQQQNEVQDTLALIDQIASDPALSANVGPIDSRGLGFVRDPGGNARFTSLHDQLVGKMSLAQAGKLKGQGQISDKERAMLAAAATALNRGLQDPDYKNELGKVRKQFEQMANPGALPAHGAGGTIRARDPQGNLHEAAAGTTLPAGWKLEGGA